MIYLLLWIVPCGYAQPLVNPAGAVAAPAPDPAVNDLLVALQRRGEDLQDFTADVSLTETDQLGAEKKDVGRFWFQRKPGGDARIRVSFDRKILSGHTLKQRHEYVLDNGKLIEQNYDNKTQITRRVLKPGQKFDPLKLGEGPFPLPIGQEPAEVLKNFEVTLKPLTKDDPPNTTHASLKPRKGTRLERKFESIDVFVDPKTHFPSRVETVDHGTVRTADLSNIKINQGLKDADFQLPEPGRDWGVSEEDLAD
jgi:outer membrane lipoprotein-sorting protein